MKAAPGSTSAIPAANATRPAVAPAPRLLSLDAYRGFVMVFMASEGLRLHDTSLNFDKNATWQAIGRQFDHVPWLGCVFWDMIQPSFMFMVGVAMAYSCASRQTRGQTSGWMLAHAVWRSLLLIGLGIFLRSKDFRFTYFTFEDVLTQIGLGYTFLFLLWGRKPVVQMAAAVVVLIGYWAYFFFYPLPPEDFNYAEVGVPANWQHLEGMAQHWDKNTNAGHYFDRWFLNVFPRAQESPSVANGMSPPDSPILGRSRAGEFLYNQGGYLTLSFIPSLATMIFGLLAGELLRSQRTSARKFWILVAAGVLGVVVGEVLDRTGVCPVVKRIWTPSWAIWAGGVTSLMLAAFFAVVELANFRRWAFPLVVVGMNSIAMYLMAELLFTWFENRLDVHLGWAIFSRNPSHPTIFEPYKPLILSAGALIVCWLILYWLYRRKAFVRI